jgi:hypothetical protein
MSGRRSVVKIIIAESISHDEKYVVPTPLSGKRVFTAHKVWMCHNLYCTNNSFL